MKMEAWYKIFLSLVDFKNRFGFELIKADDKEFSDFLFERKVDGETHRVIIEDHRWEAEEEGFDPEKDIGDWLIFSMLTDSERGWLGNYVETQYPLTYSEYKLIEKIIHELEVYKKGALIDDGGKGASEEPAGDHTST